MGHGHVCLRTKGRLQAPGVLARAVHCGGGGASDLPHLGREGPGHHILLCIVPGPRHNV